MMKARTIENMLALVGAVIVLVGVSFAAGTALAEETAARTIPAVIALDIADTTIRGAREANRAAADAAAATLALENWIDLEVRFQDHTLLMVAGGN
jgi:hypothetical protein